MDEDVLQFDVSVDDFVFPQLNQSHSQLIHHFKRKPLFEVGLFLALHELPDVPLVAVVHNQKVVHLVLEDFVKTDYEWRVDLLHYFDFSQEVRVLLLVIQHLLLVHTFEGIFRALESVPHSIHSALGPNPDFLHQSVVVQDLLRAYVRDRGVPALVQRLLAFEFVDGIELVQGIEFERTLL